MAFRWRADDGPLKKGIWILSLPSSTEKKLPQLEPFDPLLDAHMEEVPGEVPTTYLEDGLYAIWSVFKQ